MIPQSMIGMPSFNIYDYMHSDPRAALRWPSSGPRHHGWDVFQSVMLDRAIDQSSGATCGTCTSVTARVKPKQTLMTTRPAAGLSAF